MPLRAPGSTARGPPRRGPHRQRRSPRQTPGPASTCGSAWRSPPGVLQADMFRRNGTVRSTPPVSGISKNVGIRGRKFNPGVTKGTHTRRPGSAGAVGAPIFAAASFACHEAVLDERAAQPGRVGAVPGEHLIHPFLGVAHPRIKIPEDVPHENEEFFLLHWK